MSTKATWKIKAIPPSEFGFWHGLAIIAVVAGAVWALSVVFSFGPVWEDGLYTTAVLFSALMMALRPAWSNRAFWRDFVVALAIHTVFLAIVVEVFIWNSLRMGGPWRTLVAVVEGIFLLSILWRRNVSVRH